MSKVEVEGSCGGHAFAQQHDNADAQIFSPISSRANNIDPRKTKPSQAEDFIVNESFIVKGHIEELIAANVDDMESNYLLNDFSYSEQSSEK